jgi:non-ribosomal peptide synthetase-like protein
LGVVTTRAWADQIRGLPVTAWFVEDLLEAAAPRQPATRPLPSDPAYVIYTSGSTGVPKGIAISQANICHFLRSENAVLGIRSEDRVYQGFSVAFDMSLEEVWISYLVGASVWVAPAETVADPEAISHALERENLTVLHAVPTLAALLPEIPKGIRLINLGGEACPDSLAERLCLPGVQVFNTYGPTETTVSASVAELLPHKSVTIGVPLPNYGIAILDEHNQPVGRGEAGEIAVFGPGVSLGYLQRPELNAAKFVQLPLGKAGAPTRVYLTGDLGRISPQGEVVCLGRRDSQVKLRGFRIELDEISAALCTLPGVGTAATVLRPLYGSDEIVAFVVPCAGSLDGWALRRLLQTRLPHYMIPARIESVATLPRLASGKVRLESLRELELSALPSTESDAPSWPDPGQPWEVHLHRGLRAIFPDRPFLGTHDFFSDLGGHSLLAARLVTRLRREKLFASVGVQLIYRERTLHRIAQSLQSLARQSAVEAEPAETAPRERPPLGRRLLCGIGQALCLPFLLLLRIFQWLAPFFSYHALTGGDSDRMPTALAASILVFLLATFLAFPLSIFLKRFVAGKLSPGGYPLWGWHYFRWWLGARFEEIAPVHLISGTQWNSLYYRMLGAKIGRDTLLNAITVAAPELLEIGSHVCIGTFVNFENARVEGGRLWVGPIRIADGASVDSYSVLEENTRVGLGSRLGGQSSLGHGRAIPEGEHWAGAPAARKPEAPETEAPAPPLGRGRHAVTMAFYAAGAALISVLFFVPTFPVFMLVDWLDARTVDTFEAALEWWQTFPLFFLMALPASVLLVLLTALIAGGLRRIFPRPDTGKFPIHGATYCFKWLFSSLFETSLHVLYGLYASVFVGFWLRLMGAHIERGAEVSTAVGITPDLLSIGEDSFVADGVLLGDEAQRAGWMHLKGTRIGARSFIGNGAYVADGTQLPEDVLIGVQSATPANELLKPGQTWLGSPALILPARETLCAPDLSLTFRPSTARRIARGVIETLRIVVPLSWGISGGYAIVYQTMALWGEAGLVQCATSLLGSSLVYAASTLGLVVALKWVCIGRYTPRRGPMWTPFVWISEAITVLYESLAVPTLLDPLRGTPMLPWALRLLGTHVGRGDWINTTDLTEFDCVSIGDFAELNAHSGPQTHLFEDRIMRIGEVEIGAHSTLGPRTTVLYDARVGEGCRLGPLTLLTKGEHLPSHTRWEGTPANAVPSSQSPAHGA